MPKLIRRGITRTVWLVGAYAIKFPSLRPYGDGLAGLMWSISRGIQANLSERQWSTNAPDDPVCHVLWSFGGIVNVYPRCKPVPVDPITGKSLMDLPARQFLPLGDAKAENFGLLAGRAVWIDYDVSYNGCVHDKGGVQQKKRDLAEDLAEAGQE